MNIARDPSVNSHIRLIYLNFHMIRHLSIFVILLVTFFERPWWCHNQEGNCRNDKVYMNSGLPQLDPIITDGIQLACLAILLVDMILKYMLLGRKIFMESTLFIQATLIAISAADTFFAMGVPVYRETVWISPFLRPWIFMFMFARVRNTTYQIVRIIPIIAELIVLLVLLLVSFAWFGLILFFEQGLLPLLFSFVCLKQQNSSLTALTRFCFLFFNLPTEETESFSKQYFDTFGHSLLNMFILMTTANSPDVRMPIYTRYRPSVFYFIAFLMIGMHPSFHFSRKLSSYISCVTALYFILPFIFSTVYNNYKSILTETEQYYLKKRNKALVAAFHLLDQNNSATIDVEICRYVQCVL